MPWVGFFHALIGVRFCGRGARWQAALPGRLEHAASRIAPFRFDLLQRGRVFESCDGRVKKPVSPR